MPFEDAKEPLSEIGNIPQDIALSSNPDNPALPILPPGGLPLRHQNA